MGLRQRKTLLVPLLVAAWAVLACAVGQLVQPGNVDWTYFWTAGHSVVAGQNPYDAVARIGTGYPLYYPGPALLILAPFGLLPIRVAWLAFAGVCGYLYGMAAQRYGRGLLVGCLSASFLEAIIYGQWSPLLVAGAVLPGLGFVLAAKPSIGAALYAWRPHRWTVAGGITVSVISLLVIPSWPRDWLAALGHTNHVPPVLRPWGWILLLAGFRWRTPEGRLLLALALVPQTTGLYESLYLFLIPRNRMEGYGLVGLSYLLAFGQGAWISGVTIEAGLAARWPLILVTLYVPALGLVLWPTAARAARQINRAASAA